jgi:rod shape determining protein RodA
MTDRSPTISKGIDWALVWLYLLLVAIGITAIFTVTYKEGDPLIQSFLNFRTDYSKQFYYFLISLLLAIFILLTDSKFFTATANLWYAFGILLMLLVFPFHSSVKGTESIIRIGKSFQFQPAEFCKICVALALAKYLSRIGTEFVQTRSQLIAAGIVIFPALLTIMQSETGLALVYLAFFIVMYREGLPSTVLIIGFSLATLVVATLLVDKIILSIALIALAVLFIFLFGGRFRGGRSVMIITVVICTICVGTVMFGVPYAFKHALKFYQVERIYSTVGRDIPKEYLKAHEKEANQASNKKAVDYNVSQSKIAIGSGGVVGKGLLKSTQTRGGFVPEQRTDFIFDTIGEGFGFIGSAVLLAIYLLLLFRIVTVAERQRSVFSRAYAYGVAAVLFFHMVINIGMTIGLAPVIGIPLPFISYGGTSLLTFSIMLFILIRLDADRQMVLR